MPAVKTPEEYFLEAQPTLSTIKPEDYQPMNMPEEQAMQEGARTGALVDKYGELLVEQSDINPAFIASYFTRAGAYSYTVAAYETNIDVADANKEEYDRLKREMIDLRRKCLGIFDYVFRREGDHHVRGVIDEIKVGYGVIEGIKDMLSISNVAKEQRERLEQAKADMALFERALELHMRMSYLGGAISTSPERINAAKDMCAKAWTWLWEAIDEIFAAGRYVFMDQPDIQELFYVDYLQKVAKKSGQASAATAALGGSAA
jgi:hypothetical protein